MIGAAAPRYQALPSHGQFGTAHGPEQSAWQCMLIMCPHRHMPRTGSGPSRLAGAVSGPMRDVARATNGTSTMPSAVPMGGEQSSTLTTTRAMAADRISSFAPM